MCLVSNRLTEQGVYVLFEAAAILLVMGQSLLEHCLVPWPCHSVQPLCIQCLGTPAGCSSIPHGSVGHSSREVGTVTVGLISCTDASSEDVKGPAKRPVQGCCCPMQATSSLTLSLLFGPEEAMTLKREGKRKSWGGMPWTPVGFWRALSVDPALLCSSPSRMMWPTVCLFSCAWSYKDRDIAMPRCQKCLWLWCSLSSVQGVDESLSSLRSLIS